MGSPTLIGGIVVHLQNVSQKLARNMHPHSLSSILSHHFFSMRTNITMFPSKDPSSITVLRLTDRFYSTK
ncbi:hypothetical protein C345_07064 [Cryptococcus neoformans A2-102-5]|nr:hypothetical protein C345_07064 [Cryptococcus neoformans var. grubii A2-102-5]